MQVPRKAPKCGGCGNHPRSKLHVEQCGNPGTRVQEEPVNTFKLGQTCLTCSTIYTVTPFPLYQEKDTKHGDYDVTRQLPHTSANYPECALCLPWQWRAEAKRYGVEKKVREMYPDCFR